MRPNNLLVFFWALLYISTAFPAGFVPDGGDDNPSQELLDQFASGNTNAGANFRFYPDQVLISPIEITDSEERLNHYVPLYFSADKATIFSSCSEDVRFFQLRKSSQNRKKISLFILYHSWKNFIS